MEKKFRTKNQRHVYDDEKRKESLEKKLKEQLSQKELIKKALSDAVANKARKIVFDDEIVTENGIEGNINTNGNEYAGQKDSEEKPHLFEDSDDDREENYEIKIKSQFEGKKGHKLLNLQSKYNNDERFRLDERFKDDSDSDDEDDKEVINKDSNEENDRKNIIKTESNEFDEEKTKQLKVLETVLGRPIQSTCETEKKPKQSFYDMVRFDASNEDHKRKQSDVGCQMEEGPVKKKKKKKHDMEERNKRKEEGEKQEKPSKESQNSEKKFYEISDDLKSALKNRKSENSQFSLLKAFSKKSISDDEDDEEEEEEEEVVMEAEDVEMYNQMRRESEDDAVEEDRKIVDSRPTTNEESKEVGKVQGITKEKFFFTHDDPRIEEGLIFINMKNSEEAGKAIENYDETRRDIREVLRLRWQKHRQKNNPFKKKIGGSAKQKMPFNKNRKQFGKNVVRRKR